MDTVNGESLKINWKMMTGGSSVMELANAGQGNRREGSR